MWDKGDAKSVVNDAFTMLGCLEEKPLVWNWFETPKYQLHVWQEYIRKSMDEM